MNTILLDDSDKNKILKTLDSHIQDLQVHVRDVSNFQETHHYNEIIKSLKRKRSELMR